MLACMRNRALTGIGLCLGLVAFGCAGAPASPFDEMKHAPITLYRLQNYEPPPQAPTAPNATSMIPGLPAEIQQWIQAGASMLPPGLLPPGMIPGQAPAMPQQQVDNVPRFYGFRILGQAPVTDERLRKELIELFGYEKNFDNTYSGCMYAEFGVSFARMNQPPADILISLSCDQVQPQNFAWPHRNRGLTPEAVQRLVRTSQSVFVGG